MWCEQLFRKWSFPLKRAHMELSPKISSQEKRRWHRKYATSKPYSDTQIWESWQTSKAHSGKARCLCKYGSEEGLRLEKLFVYNEVFGTWGLSTSSFETHKIVELVLCKNQKEKEDGKESLKFQGQNSASTQHPPYLYSYKTSIKYFLLPAKFSLPSKEK